MVLLEIEQDFSNHNGGNILFGPDGYLYIGMGDGGSAEDPNDRAQDLTQLLGKMLRIDVDGATTFGKGVITGCGLVGNYAIPADNPYVGDGNACDEIWAYGLRNPWRFSFDRATGDLIIADVGQSTIEEIDFQPAPSTGGENYGWSCMEGDVVRQLQPLRRQPAHRADLDLHALPGKQLLGNRWIQVPRPCDLRHGRHLLLRRLLLGPNLVRHTWPGRHMDRSLVGRHLHRHHQLR